MVSTSLCTPSASHRANSWRAGSLSPSHEKASQISHDISAYSLAALAKAAHCR